LLWNRNNTFSISGDMKWSKWFKLMNYLNFNLWPDSLPMKDH
jgi:hypothetical protein